MELLEIGGEKDQKLLFYHSNPFPPSHITSQIGMFSYVGLTKDQCVWLQKERSLYLLKSSRISMCGVTPDNIDYVAKAISEAVARGQ